MLDIILVQSVQMSNIEYRYIFDIIYGIRYIYITLYLLVKSSLLYEIQSCCNTAKNLGM